MVDQSELPFRLLVRRHGVGLCYTPMIHSPTFSQPSASIIRRNAYDGGPSLAADRPLIAQLCGNDGATLVAAGRYIEHDVDAIDLNLGCPQGIARKGSYGAYLLEQDGGRKAVGLVRAMAEGLRCPVTVKMRRLETAAATVELARRLEDAGAQVVTLHGRTLRQAKTRQGAACWDTIGVVKRALVVPVIANGGVETAADAERCLRYTGADAVMSSEALLEDPALFDAALGRCPPLEALPPAQQARRQLRIALEYIALAERFPSHDQSTKTRAHLFKILHRLLSCPENHDLRAELGDRRTRTVPLVAALFAALCNRYGVCGATGTELAGTLGGESATTAAATGVDRDLPVSRHTWYRRHWQEEADAAAEPMVERRVRSSRVRLAAGSFDGGDDVGVPGGAGGGRAVLSVRTRSVVSSSGGGAVS